MNNINEQKPAGKNQITNIKPNSPSSISVLEGVIANSMNGGQVRPVATKIVMAGEKHYEYRITGNMRMLTSLVPPFQKLKATFSAYFVPNSRVWVDSDKFESQKGGSTQTKVRKMPVYSGWSTTIKSYTEGGTTKYANLTDTTLWRDSWLSCYIPRIYQGNTTNTTSKYPEFTVLGHRGFRAIYNDYLRNKEYDRPLTEFTSSGVTVAEESILDGTTTITDHNIDSFICRGKRNTSYYTDFRSELLGQDPNAPTMTHTGDLINWKEWEKQLSEYRSEAENAQLNDWDIMAKIRGTKPLTEGKVQLLGKKTIGLNFTAVSQTAYNTNSSVSQEFQALGTQGAYSYTEFDIPIYQMKEFNEPGIIHILVQISANTVFECAVDRTYLNVTPESQYRPDLKDLKHDVMYKVERDCTSQMTSADTVAVKGYKRKYSEYFKLPTLIAGDMCSNGYLPSSINTSGQINVTGSTLSTTQKPYQFFEVSDTKNPASSGSGIISSKKHWKDYTDIAINENLAVKNQYGSIVYSTSNPSDSDCYVKGNHQFFFGANCTLVAELPIDEEIKNNMTDWGEE